MASLSTFSSRTGLLAVALVSTALISAGPAIPQEVYPGPPPAGAYTLDPPHATVLFRVSHLGFSHFTAGFKSITATLDIDPSDPAQARVSARIPATSIDLPAEAPGFRETLMSPLFFDVAAHPDIVFDSTAVSLTGPDSADVTGNLTIRGVTQPVTLAVRFNGGYPGHPLEPMARIGFSATASLSRSAFGMDFGVPAPGSDFGVGDEVEVLIEAEFTGPAWKG